MQYSAYIDLIMTLQKVLVSLTYLTVISQLLQHGIALNILAIVSLPLKSHYMAFQMLFHELALRGHSVTVINNYPDINPPANLKFVDITIPRPNTLPPLSEFEHYSYIYAHELLNFRRHFVLGVQNVVADCENLFTNPNMKKFRDAGEEFDVIFVEQFMSDCGLVFAAALYDAPIIGITSHTLLPWAYPRLGIPFDFSSNAFYFTDTGTNPSLYEKVKCFLLDFYMNTLGRFRIQAGIHEIFHKYLPNVKLDIEKIAREQMKMMFVYQHYSVTGNRILPPSLLEIGGVHIKKPKPLGKDIEEFISSAEHGVIYVSFGSFLKASTMSERKLQQFLDAFKRIPQKVLWKIENNTYVAGDDNLFVKEWFPQLDILCHPKVLAFVSHGGMLSLSEAAHCATPLLTIPFFGDQFSNSASLRESGLGITMYFNDINSDTLSEAIKHLTASNMQENAKRISILWHDRPQSVIDSAIYWTEFVASHPDASLALPSASRTWFETSLLDVYSVLLFAFLITVHLIYRIVKFVLVILLNLLSSQNNSNKKQKRS